jgi:hypothetical protein
LKQKHQGKNNVCLNLPDEDPTVFRRILQYLYSQKLPVAASHDSERLQQLCQGYIMACRFELDLLQELILRSLSELQNEIPNKRFLHTAHLMYNANQAEAPFREFFRRVLQKSTNEEGLEDERYVKYSLNAIVARGGTIALDVAEVLIQLSQAKSDGCSDEFLKADIRDAEGIIESADLRFTKLEKAFGTAQKQAECDLKAAGAKVQAAERRAASAVARIDNMVFR